MKSIDLNCDLGEGFGNYRMANDAEIMKYISSANIACGFHAGDPSVMHETVALAQHYGVAIGAHPGLPDLQGFGRREMKLSPAEAYQLTVYQIGAINGIATVCKAKLHHVKAHGALYNMAARDAALAAALMQAVYDIDNHLQVYGLPGTEMQSAARKLGLSYKAEVFPDRSFQDNGTLTPRNQENAVITDATKILQQLRSILSFGRVVSINGKEVPVDADTICIHGDNPHALQLVQLVRSEIEASGIIIQAP